MRRRVAVAVAGWLALVAGTAVVVRAAVALPEHCGSAAEPGLSTAIDGAVQWFDVNQHDDGTWLYRYDAGTGTDLGGYSWIRHAGVMLSLYQASHAGVADALAVADRGRAAIAAQATHDDAGGEWSAVEEDGFLTGGGSALLTVALTERRDATGDTADDALLRQLGRFLTRQVSPDGAVWEVAYEDGVPYQDSLSPFTTGEVFFALARLHRIFPGEGWDAPALRIARYVTTVRADREGFVPDASDHWSAYAFSEVRRWPERATTGLDGIELGFARRQLGIMSIQTRYEVQRTNHGLDRWLRGRTSLGAGTGTVGEAMGAWWNAGDGESALDGRRAALRDRIDCLAGAMIDRQTTAAEVQAPAGVGPSAGAWFQFGITQMDDQQHSLSALVAARRVLADPTPLRRRSPVPTNLWVLVLVTIAALNPLRFAAGSRREGRVQRRRIRDTGLAGLVTLAVAAVLAAVGGPLTRALDVSAGNALLAAGVVLIGGGFWAFANPREGTADETEGDGVLVPLVIPLGLRPDLLVLAVAAGAGGRGWTFVSAMAVAVVGAVGIAAVERALPPIVHRWAMRLVGTAALVLAVALFVDGIYAI